MEEFFFDSADRTRVACYRWAAANPRAVLQVSHGMGEHAIRYAQVANFYTAAGFQVYANDHRGHGRTARGADELGDFGAGGWDALVEDMASLTRIARSREHNLPLILLGHSMGSFALQQYLLDNSQLIAGAVISGSAAVDMLPIDPEREGDLTAFNAEFEPARTPFDWLSRDPAAVDAYVADRLCGFGVNKRAMGSMAASLARVVDLKELARIRKDLPIYIVAGDADPINQHLERLRPLAQRYRAAGIVDVTEKYYAAGRHEMFNESNRDEVMRDLLAWMRRVVV